jgi:hypothetical protein
MLSVESQNEDHLQDIIGFVLDKLRPDATALARNLCVKQQLLRAICDASLKASGGDNAILNKSILYYIKAVEICIHPVL